MNTSNPDTTLPAPSSPVPISTHKPIPFKTILGIPFHALRMSEVLEQIEAWIKEGRARHICLANAYTLSAMRTDASLRQVLCDADLVLADGMSIVWGGRWVNEKVPERIAGPDLTSQLCALAARKGYTLFLMGSSSENLAQLTRVMLKQWPALRIVGSHSPSMCDKLSLQESRLIHEQIHRARPDILLVGMSAPKQEKWIAEHLSDMHVPICIGVGAAFDFLSGRIPRAPESMRNIGLEWLYRLCCEPRRLWKRYLLGNAIFLACMAKERALLLFFSRPTDRL